MPVAEVRLESVISTLANFDVSSLADDELGRMVLAAERLLNAARSFSAEVLEAFERRGRWAQDGAPSGVRWVAHRSASPVRELRTRVRIAAGFRLLPAAAAAARSGRLSGAHVAALAACARQHPALAARDESVLLEQAARLDAEAFSRLAQQWASCAEAVESPDPVTEPTPDPVDQLHLSRTLDGRYRLDGSFSAATGQILHAALDAEVDKALRTARDGDPAVPPVASHVRAAALIDLVGQAMRREPSDASVPDRYRVAVVVGVDDDELPVEACDAPAFRLVLGAAGEVLDVGRLTPAWPAGIRRAITHRDGGCVFPGCDRPPSWSDIHHCRPWHEGGRTSTDNGALLCRRHHTFVHKQRWKVRTEAGKAVVRRPDDARYVIARWRAEAA